MGITEAQDSARRLFNLVDSVINTLEELADGKSLSSVWDSLNIENIGRRIGDVDNISVSVDPFNVLMQLMKRFCDKETLVEYISNIIVNELPALELAVKMALIASLKQMIDCNTDPMIPDKFRMKLNPSVPFSEPDKSDRGGFVNVTTIDGSGMLDLSPLSEAGQFAYFGTKHYYTIERNGQMLCENGSFSRENGMKFYKYIDAVNKARELSKTIGELALEEVNQTSPLGGKMVSSLLPSDLVKSNAEIDSIWELARAEDFNAFLWFVEKKACFTNHIDLGEEIKSYSAGTQAVFSGTSMADKTVLDALLADFSGDTSQYYEAGDSFIQSSGGTNSSVMSLCIKEEKIGGKTLSTIVPTTRDYISANWYVNRNNYFTRNLTELVDKYGGEKLRDYGKEFALCNVRYSGILNKGDYSPRGTFQVQIMPKPFIHLAQNVLYDSINYYDRGLKTKKQSGFAGASIPIPIKLLFTSDGKSSKGMEKGKYTVRVREDSIVPEFKEETNCFYYDIVLGNDESIKCPYRIKVDRTLKYEFVIEEEIQTTVDVVVGVEKKSGEVEYRNGVTEGSDGKIHFDKSLDIGFSETQYDDVKIDYNYYVPTDGDDFFSESDVTETVYKKFLKDIPMSQWNETQLNEFKHYIPFILHECYPGLTVYEFNYDFIMGMRLYDSKVIVSRLLDICTNMSAGLKVNKYMEYDMRISEIVDNIITSYDSAVSDCFYSFSNEQYDAMLRESEKKRSQLYTFNGSSMSYTRVDLSSVYSQLNELGGGDLSGDSAIITRAINDASVKVSDGSDPIDRYNIESNFVHQLIKAMTSVLTSAILTPKVLFILNLNKQIAEGKGSMSGGCENVECFIRNIGNIITDVVKKIVNYLLFQMETFVIDKMMKLNLKLGEKIVAEQLEWYALLMKDLIANCVFLPSKVKNLETTLDAVNYADITDVNNTVPQAEC